jgi:hypothetical protein
MIKEAQTVIETSLGEPKYGNRPPLADRGEQVKQNRQEKLAARRGRAPRAVFPEPEHSLNVTALRFG